MTFLVLAQVVTDPAWTVYDINELSLRQVITPDRLQGRMNATIRVVGFAAMLIGTFAAGLLGETIGLRQTLFVAAGVQFVAVGGARALARGAPDLAAGAGGCWRECGTGTGRDRVAVKRGELRGSRCVFEAVGALFRCSDALMRRCYARATPARLLSPA